MTADLSLFDPPRETYPSVLLRLPLPPRILSTNPRSNQFLHLAQSKVKAECRRIAASAIIEKGFRASPIRLSFIFCTGGIRSQKCPHKRRAPKPGKTLRSCQRCPYAPRDIPNALGAAKSYIDGLADGLGIDDSRKYVKLGQAEIDTKRGPFVELLIEAIP